MMNWSAGKKVRAVVTLVSLAGILGACSTYKASLTLGPARGQGAGEPAVSEIFGEREVGIAERITGKIAEEHEMRAMPGPYDSSFTQPYRVLSMFRGPGDKRHVRLSAAVKQDRSEIAFVITDQEHGSETEFTASLWRRLKEKVNEQLAGFAVAEETSSTLRSPLAP